jgi:hypothetical protein
LAAARETCCVDDPQEKENGQQDSGGGPASLWRHGFSSTLAKVATNPGHRMILNEQRHFWLESYGQTFARVLPELLFSKTTRVEFEKMDVAEGVASDDVSAIGGNGNASKTRHTL